MLNTCKRLTMYAVGHTVAILLIGGVMTANVSAQRGGPAQTPDQGAVLQASSAWALAMQKNDYDAMGRLMADDFTTIQQTSTSAVLLNKAQQLEALRQSAAVRAGAQRTLDNATVRIHGTVGILTAIATYSAQTAQGPLKTQALITEVWVNEGGAWRMSHFQAATAPRRAGG
jgi:ketosteroid isomerase-like protein